MGGALDRFLEAAKEKATTAATHRVGGKDAPTIEDEGLVTRGYLLVTTGVLSIVWWMYGEGWWMLVCLLVLLLITLFSPMIAEPVSRGRGATTVRASVLNRCLMKAVFIGAAAVLWIASPARLNPVAAGELTRAVVQIAVPVVSMLLVALAILAIESVVIFLGPFRVLRRSRPDRVARFCLRINRVFGHLACDLTWICVATWGLRNFFAQALIWGLGVFLLPALAEVAIVRRRPNLSFAELRWLRRPWIYLSTVFGLACLIVFARSWELIVPIVPIAAVLGFVLFARFTLWVIWRRRWARGAIAEPDEIDDHGPAYYGIGVYVWVALVAIVAAPAVFERLQRDSLWDDQQRRRLREARVADDLSAGVALELFVISDNQFRSVAGRPGGTHVQVIDDHASASLRPIVLDLLSGVTLKRFADTLGDHKQGATYWAHLGDFGDLSCDSELERFASVKALFDAHAQFAGIARGNHDGFYIGNFAWAPDWRSVCGGDPARSDSAIAKLREPFATTPSDDSGGADFMARVKRMKIIEGGEQTRTLNALFVDTSDYGLTSIGIAGVGGSISGEQCDWLRERTDADYVLVFQHHPFASLSGRGQGCLEDIASSSNLLALVSAHTHLAAARPCQLHNRRGACVPELVVGSTTDAPQEAAWLRLLELDGTLRLRFRTVQPIERPTRSRTPSTGSLPECGVELRRVYDHPACVPLTLQTDEFSYNSDPDQVREVQRSQARELLACLDAISSAPRLRRPNGDRAAVWPLDHQIFADLEAAARQSPLLERTMVCLSWTASRLADTVGTTLREAIRCELGGDCPDTLDPVHAPMTCDVSIDDGELSCAALGQPAAVKSP